VRSDIPADLLADQVSATGDGWAIMFPVEPVQPRPDKHLQLANWLFYISPSEKICARGLNITFDTRFPLITRIAESTSRERRKLDRSAGT
jgi:hypothetical protein